MEASIESRMFGYLKRTVSILALPNRQVEASRTKMFFQQENGAVEVNGLNSLKVEPQKRKQSFYSPCVMKRKKFENSSITRKDLCIDMNAEDNKERDSMINQMLWTLKYLKCNPIINDEMLDMIKNLCEGLEKIIAMSRFNFTDMEFRRFLKISDTLFTLITSFDDDNHCLIMSSRIYDNVDNLFDKFLEHFTEQESNAEEQLNGYGFISTIISQVKEFIILKKLTDKLLLRLYTTTTVLWKACISCPRGTVQAVHSVEISLFFYYCQLLEVVVESTNHSRLKELVHQNLNILTEDAGSLFAFFPNLAYILYSTILATGQNLKPKPVRSPLKEIIK